jgi:hypothetical protein
MPRAVGRVMLQAIDEIWSFVYSEQCRNHLFAKLHLSNRSCDVVWQAWAAFSRRCRDLALAGLIEEQRPPALEDTSCGGRPSHLRSHAFSVVACVEPLEVKFSLLVCLTILATSVAVASKTADQLTTHSLTFSLSVNGVFSLCLLGIKCAVYSGRHAERMDATHRSRLIRLPVITE